MLATEPNVVPDNEVHTPPRKESPQHAPNGVLTGVLSAVGIGFALAVGLFLGRARWSPRKSLTHVERRQLLLELESALTPAPAHVSAGGSGGSHTR